MAGLASGPLSAPSCSGAEASTLLGPQFPPLEHGACNHPGGPTLREGWGQPQSLGSTPSREDRPVPAPLQPWQALTPLLHEAEQVV